MIEGSNWSPWDRSKTRKRFPSPTGEELTARRKAQRAAEIEVDRGGPKLIKRVDKLRNENIRSVRDRFGDY